MKNKTTAGLLALLLGGLGAHKFYLNQGGMGVLYILFCWTFIPSVVALIEAILFFTMDDATFDQKYNYKYPNNTTTSVGQNNIVINNNNSKQSVNVSEEIEKLHELKEKGIITQEEFDYKKRTLL